MSDKRKVSGKEAVRLMRAGGECMRSVLVYFLQDEVLVFRDRKGVVHKSHGTIDKLANEALLQDDWVVVKEPPGHGPWVCGCVYEHGPNCGLKT